MHRFEFGEPCRAFSSRPCFLSSPATGWRSADSCRAVESTVVRRRRSSVAATPVVVSPSLPLSYPYPLPILSPWWFVAVGRACCSRAGRCPAGPRRWIGSPSQFSMRFEPCALQILLISCCPFRISRGRVGPYGPRRRRNYGGSSPSGRAPWSHPPP